MQDKKLLAYYIRLHWFCCCCRNFVILQLEQYNEIGPNKTNELSNETTNGVTSTSDVESTKQITIVADGYTVTNKLDSITNHENQSSQI